MEFDGEQSQIDFMVKREVERQVNIQKKKDHKDLGAADNEKVDYFQKIFNEKYYEIFNLITNTKNLSKSDLPDYFNNISNDILTLQKYVAASSLFLRNYDIKKCQQSLNDLTIKCKLLEEELLPKKRFGFKNKTKPNKIDANSHTKIDVVDSKNDKIIDFKANFCGYHDKKSVKLCLRSDEIYKKDVTLENLEDCQITLLGTPSTLHLNHIKDCTILSGPVSTSIFIENCENSNLSIACQQLRLHSSKNVTIFLHVTSRAIMEDCTDIIFGPYNFHYQDKESDFAHAGLDLNINNWKSIDDFNWLNIDKPSPNWRLFEPPDD
ncbi:unnamed protein product [Brassicogethes aeneus]|uniref:C-CAP/cofactor C-like domain-containing protein n=1 Tax=Brassicogethes aeneus TaxID=1431903 RepID=A0A9P0BDD3_BRAAE|nr:unnamed protein product [Brassicogethes aeneus]